MIFRTLREDELMVWAGHCAGVFGGPNDTIDYFSRHFLNDPFRDFDGVMIAEDEATGQIAATVRVFRREIYMGGEKVPMGGIGEVSTKKEYRRQGLSGHLLKMAIAYMERTGLVTSMLFTGSNRHYAHYGWYTVNMRNVLVDAADVRELPGGAALRPLVLEDMVAVRGLHSLCAPARTGCVVRDESEYWARWVKTEWKQPYVVEQDGRIVAYVDFGVNTEKKVLHARDFAEAKDGPGCLSVLGAYAKTFAKTFAEPFVLSVHAQDLPLANERFSERMDAMVRLNAPFTLGNKTIDTASKLAACLADLEFWDVDGF